MPARQLLQVITSSDVTEMMAFYELDPFGEQRADYRNAMFMHLFYDMNRGKGSKALRVNDFMPYSEHKKPEAYQMIQAAIRGMRKRG